MRFVRLMLCWLLLAIPALVGVHAAGEKIGIVVASVEADPTQYSVLKDLMANLVTQRAQLDLDGQQLPIEMYDAGRHAHQAALQKLGITDDKMVSIGVCTMEDGEPGHMLTLQGPVTNTNASVSVTMRRVQFLLGLQGVTSDVPVPVQGDRMRISDHFEKDGRVRTIEGSILAPMDLWNALAMLQPPPNATGPFGLPTDDALLGQRAGFGYRELGRLGRTYLKIDSFLFTQPHSTHNIGVQVGTVTDPYRLTDTSLGAALFDLRPDIERDLRTHLHLGAH